VRRRKEKQYWGRKEKVKEKGKRKKALIFILTNEISLTHF